MDKEKLSNLLNELEKKCRGNKNKFVEKDIVFLKDKILSAFASKTNIGDKED